MFWDDPRLGPESAMQEFRGTHGQEPTRKQELKLELQGT